MTGVRRYELGRIGVAWVREQLGAGGSLSTAILTKTDVDAGRALTYLPPGLEKEATGDLSDGGLFPTADLASAARNAIVALFQSISGQSLVVESDVGSPKSPKVLSRADRAFVCDGYLYWYRPMSGPVDELELFIRRGGSGYPTNAFGVESIVGPFAPLEEVPAEMVQHFAPGMRAILCNGYDAESYVLWHSGQVKPPSDESTKRNGS